MLGCSPRSVLLPVAPRRARALRSRLRRTIDGPSPDVLDARRRRDGRGRHAAASSTASARRGARTSSRRSSSTARWRAAAAHRRGPGLRLVLAAHRRRQRRSPGRHLGAGVRRRHRPPLLGLARSGRAPLPGADCRSTSNVGEARRHLPVARHEPGRRSPTSPTACWPATAPRTRTLPPGYVRSEYADRALQRLAVVRAGPCRPTATSRRRSSTPTALNSPKVRHRRDRQRDRRLPGARRRLRRSRVGAPAVRRHPRHPAARQPAAVGRLAAAGRGRRALARRDRLRSRRGRLSPAGRASARASIAPASW